MCIIGHVYYKLVGHHVKVLAVFNIELILLPFIKYYCCELFAICRQHITYSGFFCILHVSKLLLIAYVYLSYKIFFITGVMCVVHKVIHLYCRW